jgi:PAS domain S-box-containing protein
MNETAKREKTQEALQESEEHLRSLMERVADFAVFRLARDPSEQAEIRVVFASPSLKKILGVKDPQNFKSWVENVHPDDADRLVEANRRAFQTQRFNEEVRVHHPEKSEWRWVQAISTGIPASEDQSRYVNGIIFDITERKRTADALKEREKELEIKTTTLEDVNAALRVLLKKRDEDRKAIEEKILINVHKMILPYLEKLRNRGLDERQQTYYSIIESNLKEIVSPFASNLSSKHIHLTPTEIQVCGHIRNGRTTRQIAEKLKISPRTVESHRGNIRKKLGLKNRKGNLRTHLLSLR